jgi:hypothetical protein
MSNPTALNSNIDSLVQQTKEEAAKLVVGIKAASQKLARDQRILELTAQLKMLQPDAEIYQAQRQDLLVQVEQSNNRLVELRKEVDTNQTALRRFAINGAVGDLVTTVVQSDNILATQNNSNPNQTGLAPYGHIPTQLEQIQFMGSVTDTSKFSEVSSSETLYANTAAAQENFGVPTITDVGPTPKAQGPSEQKTTNANTDTGAAKLSNNNQSIKPPTPGYDLHGSSNRSFSPPPTLRPTSVVTTGQSQPRSNNGVAKGEGVNKKSPNYDYLTQVPPLVTEDMGRDEGLDPDSDMTNTSKFTQLLEFIGGINLVKAGTISVLVGVLLAYLIFGVLLAHHSSGALINSKTTPNINTDPSANQGISTTTAPTLTTTPVTTIASSAITTASGSSIAQPTQNVGNTVAYDGFIDMVAPGDNITTTTAMIGAASNTTSPIITDTTASTAPNTDSGNTATSTVASSNNTAPPPPPTATPKPQTYPTNISLKRVNVSAPVQQGVIKPAFYPNGTPIKNADGSQALQWDSPPHDAIHHTNTPDCGQAGNVIVAGHNYWGGPGVFYNLHLARPGDIVSCTSSDKDKSVVNYKVVAMSTREPTDMSWYTPPSGDDDKNLVSKEDGVSGHYITLYTCNDDYQKRIVVLAIQQSQTQAAFQPQNPNTDNVAVGRKEEAAI